MKVIRFVKLHPDAKVPKRASSGAVGYDVWAFQELDLVSKEPISDLPTEIPPGEARLFGIGIKFAVDFPYDCQVRPRSGLASKYNIELGNSPGTVDPDYRGEIGILLRNRGYKSFTVHRGDRIAQLIFTKAKLPHLEEVRELPPTARDTGGFGSTGLSAIELGDGEYLALQRRWDKHYMRIAVSASLLSNCLRGAQQNESGEYRKNRDGSYVGATRRFGCVIVQNGNVVATGFNHRNAECTEQLGCVRTRENILSGLSLERGCYHAEQVAVQNHSAGGGPSLDGATVYVNAAPCVMCAKLLAGCKVGSVIIPDPQSNVYDNNGLEFLRGEGIEIRMLDMSTLDNLE